MTLMIDLPLEVERQLREEASRSGKTPEDLARSVLEERFRREETRARQIERNQAAIALLDQWLAEGPDLEEAEGYPETIEPLRLREISVDP
jgi:hypothetical protein